MKDADVDEVAYVVQDNEYVRTSPVAGIERFMPQVVLSTISITESSIQLSVP